MGVNHQRQEDVPSATEAAKPPEIPDSFRGSSDSIDITKAIERLTITSQATRSSEPSSDNYQNPRRIAARGPSTSKGPPAMDDGAIAGVTIGVIVALGLLVFCFYPIVVRSIRRRRDARQPKPDLEVATVIDSIEHPGVARVVAPRPRTISQGSLVQTSRGKPDLSAEHGSGFPQLNGHQAQLPDMSAIPRGMPPTDFAPANGHRESDDEALRAFPNYDGEFFPASTPNDQPGVLKGNNADYYSPDIPSEAFGMVSYPTGEDEPAGLNRTERSMSRSSSLRRNVSKMLRRMSTRDRTMSGSEDQGSRPSITLQARDRSILPSIDTGHYSTSDTIVASPTGINGDASFHHGAIPVTGQESRISSVNGAVTPPLSSPAHARKPRPSPSNPAPGTVNPMDIMPATTFSEMSYRTEYQLENYQTVKDQPFADLPEIDVPADGPSPHTTAEPPTEQQTQPHHTFGPSHIDLAPIREPADEEMGEDHEIPDDNYLRPGGLEANGRHPSSASDVSTPLPGPASTVPSSQNTPSTALDSPSPQSIGSSGYRHSASPPMVMSSSPKTGQFRCGEVGCSQTFDQPHKLKHHQRYHAKEHKCHYPACGRGFGTKTHLQRHINDRHEKTKKYHCAIPDCDYSRAGGRAFPRKDNWKRHMTKIHGMESHNLPEPEEVDTDMHDT